MEKQSKNFTIVYNENDPKNYSYSVPLNSPSGSESENLSPNEVLIVIVMNYQSMVFEVIVAAYYFCHRFYTPDHGSILSYGTNHAKAEKAE